MTTTACAQNVPRKRIYSITELVAEFGGTKWFWRSKIWAGELPFIQTGRKIFIESGDLDNFINARRTSF